MRPIRAVADRLEREDRISYASLGSCGAGVGVGVGTDSFALFLGGTIRKGLASGMLTVPQRLRLAVAESNRHVLPCSGDATRLISNTDVTRL